ncbi:MAG: hypothetical protein IPK08_19670 [Bacteroidetes bacterium]|nr:hypothetical protein [Bacteroidota bacterium]
MAKNINAIVIAINKINELLCIETCKPNKTVKKAIIDGIKSIIDEINLSKNFDGG